MKKNVIIISFLLLVPFFSFGQAWEWVNTGVSEDTDNSKEVCVDYSGNVYAIGETYGDISFGSVSLTTTSEKLDYLVKYNSDGDVLWAVKLLESDDGLNALRGITTDDAGNVIIVGFYSNTVSLAGVEFVSLGMFDTFIVKIDSDGDVVWAKSGGGTHNDEFYDVVCDGQDYYIVAGFTDQAIFGGIELLAPSSNWNDEIAIVKYLSNGDVDWAVKAGGSSYDNPTGIAYDGSNIFITGYFSSSDAAFGTDILDCEGITNVFLAQIDPTSGTFDWAKGFETGHGTVGAYEKQGPHIEVDDNSIYMSGYYRNDFIFSETVTLNESDDNAFIASFSKTGDLNWVNEITTTTEECPYPLSMSYSDGNVYIVGEYMNNITSNDYEMIGTQAGGMAISLKNAYIFSYAANGDVNWGKSVDAYLDLTGGTMNISGIFADGEVVYTSGYFSKTVQVGTFELTSTNSVDPFFGKIDILGSSIVSSNTGISCNVFPNPGTNNIMINVDDSVIDSYSIFDVSGKEIISKRSIANSYTINISELDSGVYFLQINTDNGLIVKKFIKK